ncbi:tRNA 2-thiouridine(34) synthase MnmA, partial [bacterium]
MLSSKEKIIVALSGGVDSAVSALKLSRMGFNIIGVTFKLWEFQLSPHNRRDNLCCSSEGILAAQELCRKLNCEHIIYDVSEQFFQQVVKDFLSEYKLGRTPNPCIICNPQIKWSHLIKLADKLGANYVATGHYARTFRTYRQSFNLVRGADREKDQSYFLYRLSQQQLARTKFPVGNMLKSQVQNIAKSLDL